MTSRVVVCTWVSFGRSPFSEDGVTRLRISDLQALQFPGGERHPVVPEVGREVELRADLWSPADVMDMLLTVDALRRAGAREIRLEIPYFPYARQDRVANLGEALGVKVMADLVNGLRVDSVTVWDPHSDVTPALLDRCRVIPQWHFTAALSGTWDAFVAPDAGAWKKAYDGAAARGIPMIPALKHRDTRTGEITGTVCPGDFTGKRLLIVDDICDGGRTFIDLAVVLKNQGAASVDLFVTHGIFSRGEDILRPHIDAIYCPNRRLKCTKTP